MELPKTSAASNVLARRLNKIAQYLTSDRSSRLWKIFELDEKLPDLSNACRADGSCFDPEMIAALRTYLPEINDLVRKEAECDETRAREIDELIANLPDVPERDDE